MPARRSPRPRWSMFPTLHSNISHLISPSGLNFEFHNLDDEINTTHTYDTSIKGRFPCRNPNCNSDGWSSMRVAITIRMYENKRYNARVYHQRCESCQWLSEPVLDDSYAERVVYRLKKWCGVEQERPNFEGRSKGPHKERFCEGCKAGHCSEGKGIDEMAGKFESFCLWGREVEFLCVLWYIKSWNIKY